MARERRIRVCECCGTRLIEHNQHMNVILRSALLKIYRAGEGPHHVYRLGLSYTECQNFQKLRYFGLLAKSLNPDGTHRRGWWQITDAGLDWVLGYEPVHSQIWTYKAEPVEWAGELVYVWQVDEPNRTYDEWSTEYRNHLDDPGNDMGGWIAPEDPDE